MYIDVQDSWQLASKLTLKRLTNAWSIYSSYQRARISRQPVITGLPISLSVEPTTACNLRCPECPSGLRAFTRPTGKLSPTLFAQVIDELADTLSYLIFYFQGEPYLHPQLTEMIRYAADRSIYTATSTNAHFLTEELAEKTVRSGLDRLIVSIDGATQQTYESYRKEGSLEKVLEGTKTLLRVRKKLKSTTPRVVWQFLVVRPNEEDIPQIRRMAKAYGVDKVAFKTAQIYDYAHGSDLMPTQEAYSRYRKMADGTYALKHRAENECWKMWHSAVMTWDGRVVPCCFDKDAHHVMGHVEDQGFSAIWHSQAYARFRSQLLENRSQLEMCKNCSEGAAVWR